MGEHHPDKDDVVSREMWEERVLSRGATLAEIVENGTVGRIRSGNSEQRLVDYACSCGGIDRDEFDKFFRCYEVRPGNFLVFPRGMDISDDNLQTADLTLHDFNDYLTFSSTLKKLFVELGHRCEVTVLACPQYQNSKAYFIVPVQVEPVFASNPGPLFKTPEEQFADAFSMAVSRGSSHSLSHFFDLA